MDDDADDGFDVDPFQRGVSAHNRGADLAENPYVDGTAEHHDWMTGWYSGESRSKD